MTDIKRSKLVELRDELKHEAWFKFADDPIDVAGAQAVQDRLFELIDRLDTILEHKEPAEETRE